MNSQTFSLSLRSGERAGVRGEYRKCRDVAGRFDTLVNRLGNGPVFAVADERVLKLHPHVKRALKRKNITLVELRAGERVKSLKTLELLTRHALTLPRSTTLLAA
jgi:hypothetical protein